VKVLPGEKCVLKHKLLVTVKLKGMKPKHRRFEPRLRVWKLKDGKTHEEFADSVYAAVEGKGQELIIINDHWKFMKGRMTSV